MKDFLLKKKWIGCIIVFVYALIFASYGAKITKQVVIEYAPVVANEVADFLPVTLQNGEIVAPENTLIQKSYGEGWQSANIILDTRVDEFEPSSLRGQGLYISKKFVYTVANNKIEIHSLKDLPDGTFDQNSLNDVMAYIEKNIGTWAFPIVLISILLRVVFAILIYTVIMHWLMAIVFKVKFSHTLRVNTLAYVGLSIATMFGGLQLGIFLSLLIILAVNFGVNFALKPAE